MGGVPIPPPLQGEAMDAEIEAELSTMSDEQHADP
jgi:hypothetical protein